MLYKDRNELKHEGNGRIKGEKNQIEMEENERKTTSGLKDKNSITSGRKQ